jgi:hypothetical protein
MSTHVLRVRLVGVVVWYLSGCAITATVPSGEPVYEPPAVVVEPPVSIWVWWPVPHYEVEHHYVVEDEHVIIRDRHYFPTYGRSRPYIRNDKGKHRGWYKHEH